MGKRKQYAFFLVAAIWALGLMMPPARADDAMLRGAQECTRHLPTMERLYNIPAHWLAAIASTESGRYHPRLRLSVPWPWTINANGKGYWFDTKQEAIDAVQRFQAQGIKSIDVGCMQVNLMYHGQAFSNLQQAFEPMYNIAYAAKFLREKYSDLNSWTKATAAYHSMQSQRGAEYYRRVYKKWQQVVDRLNENMLNAPQLAWKEKAPERPGSFAYKEDPPATTFRSVTPPGNPAAPERVKWNSIKVTRGVPQAVAPESGRVTMVSSHDAPSSDMAGFPQEAVTPLDVIGSDRAAAPSDSGSSRRYERGVLVVRAKPAQRMPEAAPPEAAPPVAAAEDSQQPDSGKGQFAPQSAAAAEESPGEFVDEAPKPHVVRPKFIF